MRPIKKNLAHILRARNRTNRTERIMPLVLWNVEWNKVIILNDLHIPAEANLKLYTKTNIL